MGPHRPTLIPEPAVTYLTTSPFYSVAHLRWMYDRRWRDIHNLEVRDAERAMWTQRCFVREWCSRRSGCRGFEIGVRRRGSVRGRRRLAGGSGSRRGSERPGIGSHFGDSIGVPVPVAIVRHLFDEERHRRSQHRVRSVATTRKAFRPPRLLPRCQRSLYIPKCL